MSGDRPLNRVRAAVAKAIEPIARHRGFALDLALAALAMVAEYSLLFDHGHEVGAGAIVLTAASGAALLVRRRAPLPVLAFTLAVATALAAAGEYPGGIPALVALFTIGERWRWPLSLPLMVGSAALLALESVASAPPTIAVWGLGLFVQTRRGYTAGLEERAAQLEREREQLAELARHQERSTIAREMHDVVAHSVSVMLVGVRGARQVLRSDPEVADDTLARVEAGGEQSMAELRRILALLRQPGDAAQARPQPSLADLEELLDGYREAGLPVRLDLVGAPRPLPGGVELSVYRLVQEALTNVLKHAEASSATVTLSFEPDGLGVEVVDEPDGRRPQPARPAVEAAGTGHGIVGMRERVALLGGRLQTGRRAGGGYRVAALLPLEEGR